jgi:aspartyl-tRNA(Asn)/glutamyl-tRNA(Gln) amidotransferase subunit A
MRLAEKVELIKNGKLKALENVEKFIERIEETRDLNIFLTLNKYAKERAREIDKRIKEGKEVGKLAGLCFAVKSNICVKDLEVNCASVVLEGYISPYNATVIDKLITEDAIVMGMVNMDQFACGSSGETSAFGATKNPKNPDLIPGGSSSGPAAAVAAGLCDFALGSDTGGSIRNPASHCGIFGLKPTYGAVSRYGLIDLAMSTDVIGPLANNIEDTKLVFEVMKGQDNFDQTTKDFYSASKLNKKSSGSSLGVIGLVDAKDYCKDGIWEFVEKRVNEFAKKNGYKVKMVQLPLDISIETYYVIAYTEFFSGTRKFDGRRFGKKIDEYGGPEVIRRIIGGSEITQAEYEGKYYREAIKAKNFIKEQFEEIFEGVDVIVLPTVPKLPHKIGDKITVEEMYAYDVFTTPASIAGVPAISIPLGKIDEKDVGLQIIGRNFEEEVLFEIGNKFITK